MMTLTQKAWINSIRSQKIVPKPKNKIINSSNVRLNYFSYVSLSNEGQYIHCECDLILFYTHIYLAISDIISLLSVSVTILAPV